MNAQEKKEESDNHKWGTDGPIARVVPYEFLLNDLFETMDNSNKETDILGRMGGEEQDRK